jgi:predicted ester cyclase
MSTPASPPIATPKALVADFFAHVRSGKNLASVGDYLAPVVIAHQLCSENPLAIERSPQDYAGHVREMIGACSGFAIDVEQMIAEDDLVYVRWTQRGTYDISDDDGATVPTPIAEFASAVYRVANGRIVEYWMQIDRMGTRLQVDRV